MPETSRLHCDPDHTLLITSVMAITKYPIGCRFCAALPTSILQGVQEHVIVMGSGMQLIEVGLAVIARPDRLPVHNDRPHP
jgi:hypothetical protein